MRGGATFSGELAALIGVLLGVVASLAMELAEDEADDFRECERKTGMEWPS